MSDAYIIHVNYDEILDEIAKLQLHDKNLVDKLTSYIDSLRKITLKLEPVLRRESHEDERQLWHEYAQLQNERLLVLDLSHEYDYIGDKVQAVNPNLDLMIKDAIEELNEHILIRVQTHRAYIDILEIRHARRLNINAIVISTVIAYLAVWEYTVREFVTGIDFPLGLSPIFNYVIALLTILPVFAVILWAFLNRRAHI